ncbi:peptidase S9 family protein [Pacificimonas flava]|uniref:Peptidase S9 family protein n=2 Tax=Pacificimonas TaxID=1960290 RepID=A0A219B5N4_9SPHN|nr:peptidase S9 family protein [Pacificimonas flava]
MKRFACVAMAALAFSAPAMAQEKEETDPTLFELMDVFQLEYATQPQVSPDGTKIAYTRRGFDIRGDAPRSAIWVYDLEDGSHVPLFSGAKSFSSPRWSPDGERIAYVSSEEGGGSQIYVRWMEGGETARLTDLVESPSSLSWSPDGRQIAFTMFQPADPDPIAKLPSPPEGAEWSARPKVIDQTFYRGDGAGFYEQGLSQLFVVSAEGGTPRQLTRDDYDYGGTATWSPDGARLFVSSDRTEDWREGQGQNDLFAVDVRTMAVTPLATTPESEFAPLVSPDGDRIAFLRRSDRKSWHVPLELWTSRLDGSDMRRVAAGLDRTIGGYDWAADGRSLYFVYDDGGTTKLARGSVRGDDYDVLAEGLGGESLGRPYSGASIDVADDAGTVAFNMASDDAPAELATLRNGRVRQLTNINADLKAQTRFGEVRELPVTAADGVTSQCWIVTPPDFDSSQTYPMILEIHGGPHANYGRRFSAEVQLYAAEGYVVTYCNPRGSTGYGDDFAMQIDQAYPSGDYDDLMAGVDAAVATGFVDPDRLFVTGGSGGGVLSAWIVGKTDRFRAAVVAKPVINWATFILTSDFGAGSWDELFQAKPWDNPMLYWEQSPLSLVGNVETPTMLLTGEEDYRTPMSETEQFYAALKIQGVPTAMVRIQGAGHGIAARPSNLISKVAYVLGWFERYDVGEDGAANVAAVSAPMPARAN